MPFLTQEEHIAKEKPELVEKIKAGEVTIMEALLEVMPLYAKQPLPGFPVRLLS